MNLNMVEMLKGCPSQLRYVHRFSACRVTRQESVAEHSFYTAFFALFIAKWYEMSDEYTHHVDVELVLTRALLHDAEESRTGDILRMFKHRDKTVADAINGAASEEAETFFDRLLPDGPLSSVASSTYFEIWQTSKDDSIEGRIVKFSDFLSALSYILQELDATNRVLLNHLTDFCVYVDSFNDERYDFIRPLVSEAQAIARREMR